jgi:hypothetical protein
VLEEKPEILARLHFLSKSWTISRSSAFNQILSPISFNKFLITTLSVHPSSYQNSLFEARQFAAKTLNHLLIF